MNHPPSRKRIAPRTNKPRVASTVHALGKNGGHLPKNLTEKLSNVENKVNNTQNQLAKLIIKSEKKGNSNNNLSKLLNGVNLHGGHSSNSNSNSNNNLSKLLKGVNLHGGSSSKNKPPNKPTNKNLAAAWLAEAGEPFPSRNPLKCQNPNGCPGIMKMMTETGNSVMRIPVCPVCKQSPITGETYNPIITQNSKPINGRQTVQLTKINNKTTTVQPRNTYNSNRNEPNGSLLIN